jgi:hypothetical protein
VLLTCDILPTVAPLPNVPSVVRVVCRQTVGTDMDVINRLYFQYNSVALSNTQMSTWCTAVATAWSAHISGSQNQITTLVEVTAEDLTSPTSSVGSATVSHAGALTDSPIAAGTAMVIGGLIARRYRGGKPRTYLYVGGSNEIGGVDPQMWSSAFPGTVQAAWAAFIAACNAAWPFSGTVQVNVSYYEGYTNFTYPSGRVKAIPKLRVGGPITDVITGYKANPNIASQRRRNQTP